MTLRSPNRGAFWNRLLIVVLLSLVVYAMIVAESGGGTFEIWRPDRMRLVLIMLIVVSVAAYEFRPNGKEPKSADFEDKSSILPTGEGSVPTADMGSVPQKETGSVPTENLGSVPKIEGSVPAFEGSVPTADMGSVPKIEGSVPTSADAEEVWRRARLIPHEFVPDERKDAEYLKQVRKAAELGHTVAMVKLGDYAFRWGWIVEAYYWTLLAQLHGAAGLDAALSEIRKMWTKEGAPPEYENVRPDFSEVQGVFARAVLRLKCGLNASLARNRLQELAKANCPEALLYLKSQKQQGAF